MVLYKSVEIVNSIKKELEFYFKVELLRLWWLNNIYHLKVHLIIISYLIELEKDRFLLQNIFFGNQ